MADLVTRSNETTLTAGQLYIADDAPGLYWEWVAALPAAYLTNISATPSSVTYYQGSNGPSLPGFDVVSAPNAGCTIIAGRGGFWLKTWIGSFAADNVGGVPGGPPPIFN